MYSIGDHVWVRDGANHDFDIPKGCSITKIDKKKIQVQDDDGKVEWITPEKIVKPIHASSVTPVNDMIHLGELEEHVILRNLFLRYKSQSIYTYIGDMLIAINPYQVLNIYSTSEVSTYSEGKADTLPPPHIFATSDKCFKTMRNTKQNQCILISGESGAGKTESTKLILQYLTAISAGGHSWIKQQVLEANPILEAFGNAKTQRNDNSSRFGKYINVHFNNKGEIEGAKIDYYLLEKSRIVTHSKNERNYHIFYALLAGLSAEEKRKLHLGNASDYKYLQGTATCKGRIDSKTLADVKAAMQILNYDEKTLSNIIILLTMILHLGNLKYKEVIINHAEGTEIHDVISLKRLSEFLAVSEQTLTDVLTKRSIHAKKEILVSNLSKSQAYEVRDALAKIMYEKIFEKIVKDINSTIQNAKARAKLTIGILDISGFENFDSNSFEQLCINYANEHLQQFFVQNIFKIEQENYASEGISWTSIEFVDNQEIIDLIGLKPLNAMSLIDEESIFPKGSDSSMLSKISLIHGTNRYFIKPKPSRIREFGIVHFAGAVSYEVTGFLDKNRDKFSRDFKRLMAESENEFLKSLFTKNELTANGNDANKRSTTLSAKFRDSLDSLLSKLHSCNPFFIRCIKPNDSQSPKIFDRHLCCRQLRYSGLTDTARIRKAGYSVHYEYAEFATHFRALAYDVDPARRNDHKHVAAKICSRAFSSNEEHDYRLGHTKLFLKEHHNAILEKQKNDVLRNRAILIQRNLRMWVARKRYLQMRRSAIIIQKTWRAYGPRKRFDALRRAVHRLQSRIRSRCHEAEFQKKRRIVISLQAQCRRYLVQKSCREKREQLRMKKVKALQSKMETKSKNSRQSRESENNIDTIFDFLNNESKSSAAQALPVREDTIRRELVAKGSFRIPSEMNDSEITSYDFYKFAAIYFTGNATPSFSKKPLKQSLLELPHLSDQLAAKALSITIMRFMGDLSEPEGAAEKSADGKPVMRTVTESLSRNFSRTDSYGKAMLTQQSPRLLMRTLRRKNKLNNVITEGIVNDEYEDWLGAERSNMEKLHFVVGHGILRPELKDEIYCQIAKQLVNNPSKGARARGWVLLSLSIGCFAPSEKFINYLKSFIKSGPSEYAPHCEKRLMRTYRNGSRTQPPCWIEMESVKYNEPISLKVSIADGNVKTIIADSASTAKEIVAGLADGLRLKDTFGFSLYITIDDKVLSLGAETDHVMDAISQCEQYAKEQGHSERNANWKLLFRKEIFAPWHDPSLDSVATDLIYHQVCKGIKHGEYRCHNENDIARIIAQQLYIQYGSKSSMPTNIKTILRANMPNPLLQANADQVLVRLEKHIVDIYKKEYMTIKNVSRQKVKESIVLYAKNTWPLLFSKFYEANKIFGPELDVSDIVIGVNSIGVYFFNDKERVLQQFSFAEISEVNYQKNENILLHNFTLSTIQREEFVFQSTNAENFVLLVNYIMEGLRRKSTYVVAIQDFIDIDNAQSMLALKKGDIIQLTEGCTGKTIMTSSWGVGEKNGVQGKFPCEFVFILPTLEKPSPTLIEFFKVDFTSKTPKSMKRLSKNLKESKYHNLKKFANDNFRPSMKALLRTNSGISSAKSSISEELWKHTREPIKAPLLAKLSDKEEQFQQAIYMFTSILKYMGDLPSNRQRIGTVYTDRIFGPALKDGLIRDEAYCQIMRQLTENEIPLSEERGWELMWLATGIMPCSPAIRKELELFLNSRDTLLAQDCLNRLSRMIKSGTIRIHPPCILEVEAVRFKNLQIFHKIYFPDSTDAAFEVHSSTRAMDVCDEISTKLQLRSRDGFSLFFRIEDRVISVPNYYFFFDFIREVIDWITRISNIDPDQSHNIKYQVLFMRKIWINCLPGHDRNADSRFHFYQEATKYLQGYHKCSKKDAIELAALIYISGHGDNREELSQMHLKSQEYVPGDMIDIMTPKEWKKRITVSYNHYKSLTQDQAKEQFLQRVYQWATFGSAFFDVRQTTDTKFPEYILVAINKNGVSIIDRNSKEILAMYSFTEISNWSSGDTYFHMTLGNFVNGRKLLCETALGYKMDDLMSSYIGYLQGNKDQIQHSYVQRSYSRSNSVLK